MDFKFNFPNSDTGLDGNGTGAETQENAKELCVSSRKMPQQVKEIALLQHHKQAAKEHLTTDILATVSANGIKHGCNLYHIPVAAVKAKYVEQLNAKDLIAKTDLLGSDLVPGEYEGGLKLWECALDLLNYLNDEKFDFKNQKVLELGCGAGIPGIFCFLNGSTVHFQDYNEEVINLITIPNVIVNAEKHNTTHSEENCKFFAGDWKRFAEIYCNLPESEKYDYILTSETIYNPTSYDDLYSIFKSALKITGRIYVAAKSYYFGVGGSTLQFNAFVTEKGDFSIKTCQVFREDLRKPYHEPDNDFSEKDLITREPIGQFTHWFEEVMKSSVVQEPNAMCLATCTKSGIPSARVVLLKGYGEDGFKFFTNGCSRKGQEMVRIEGKLVQLPRIEAEKYFHSRPRNSQIAAAVSKQSSSVKRDELLIKYETMITEYSDETCTVPMPETWSGYKVIPEVMEFWQGQSNRLHDRIRFRRLKDGEVADDELIHQGENGWVFERLAP